MTEHDYLLAWSLYGAAALGCLLVWLRMTGWLWRWLREPLRVIGAYFPNGQAPGSDKFAYKMRWLEALRGWVQTELAQHPHLVLMGDYNITFDDADVWDPEGMREAIHCTTEERTHLQALIDLGLHDSVRLFPQPEKNYSWWDYREFAFRRNRGLRIDHVLVSGALKPLSTACAVDKLPRKNERPSDHAPVVLTLNP